jgi:hypothetical protein
VLGRRHRRGHDLRHTTITLAREDEMELDILKTITHDPGGKKASSAIHAYIRDSWPVRCREILNMQVLPAPTGKSSEPEGTGSKSPSDPAPQAREILDASYTPSYTLSDSLKLSYLRCGGAGYCPRVRRRSPHVTTCVSGDLVLIPGLARRRGVP